MYSKLWQSNTNLKAMDLLLGAFVLVLCKKVPSEIGVTKIESLSNKVKLLAPPQQKQQKKDAAILRLTPLMRPSTSNSDEGANNMTEVDQEGKALATNGRTLSLPYTVPIIN